MLHRDIHAKAGSLPRVSHRAVVATVMAVALFYRLAPLLWTGTLGGFRGYDDSVHYSAAVHLLAGDLPYRDFVFVHPPGVILLMVPFAWLGSVASDHVGIAAGRLLFVLIGAANAAIISLLLRRFGLIAMVIGGGLYALWSAGTIAERSAMLSPLLNFLVLLSLLLLCHRGTRPSPAAAGGAALLLGLALTFKLWAAIPIVVIGVLVLTVFGLRAAIRWAMIGLFPVVLICAPFLVASPAGMTASIVRAQLERSDGTSPSFLSRMTFFAGSTVPVPLAIICITAMGLAVIATLASSVSIKLRGRELPPEFWWSVLAVAIVGILLTSRTFFDHYVNFAAPMICLCVGSAAGRLARAMRPTPFRLRAPAALFLPAIFMFPLAADGLALRPAQLPADTRELSAAVAAYDCVWAPFPYLSIMSNSLSRAALSGGCPVPVDQSGIWMMTAAGLPVPGNAAGSRIQSDLADIANISAADAIIIGQPHARYGIHRHLEKVLVTNFSLDTRVGAFEVWVRSSS